MTATITDSNTSLNDDDDFSEKLIQLVSEHSSLYNKADSTSTYKHAQVRENIWQNIATQMNTTPDIVSKKWKSIRDCFNRRNHAMFSKSRQAAKKIMHYKFHHHLSFLNNNVKGSSSISNLESCPSHVSSDEEVEETILGISDTQTPTTVTPGKRRKCEKPDPLTDGILSYLKEKSNRPSLNKERDSDELWLLSLAPTLRRFNDYQKGIAKMRIQQIVLDVEFGMANQTDFQHQHVFQQTLNQSWDGANYTNL